MSNGHVRSIDGLGCVYAQDGDTSAAFIALEALGRAVMVPPGTYTLNTAVPSTNNATLFVLMPGAVFTGAQVGSLLDGDHRIWDFAATLAAYPPPVGETSDRGLALRLPRNFDSVSIDKFLSDVTDSISSDSRFSAVRVQHFNSMRRNSLDHWYHVNGAAFFARGYWGLLQPARGSSLGAQFEMYAFDNADFVAGKTGGEPCGLHVTAKAHWDTTTYHNGHINVWGLDINVGGPAYGADSTKREGYLGAASFTVAKMTEGNTIDLSDVNATKRGAYGVSIQHAPGIGLLPYINGDSWAGKKSYPVLTLLPVNGYSGAYDGVNAATDGHDADATDVAETMVELGGCGGPWVDGRVLPQARWNSRYGTGLKIRDHRLAGIDIDTRHPAGTAYAIRVRDGAGDVRIESEADIVGISRFDRTPSATANWVVQGATQGGVGTNAYLRLYPENSGGSNMSLAIETLGDGQGSLVAGVSGSVALGWRKTGGVTQLGFYGATPANKPTVTGSRGSNAALTSLLTALAGLGLLTDSSS